MFGILFLIAGVVMLVVAFSNGVSRSSDYTAHTFVATDEITSYKFDISAGDFVTEFYDGDKATVEYSDSSKYEVTLTEKNGTLTVKARFKWYVFFGWWGTVPKTTIKIPRNIVPDIDYDMSAGKASLEGGNYGKMTAHLSAGTLKTGDLNCETFNCHLSAGTATMGKINCSTIDCKLSAGSVEIDGAVCNSLVCKLSAGAVEIDKIDCARTELKLSAGSAELGFTDYKHNYSISVSKSAGSCNVGDQTAYTGKSIDIDLSAGSVSCHFPDSH